MPYNVMPDPAEVTDEMVEAAALALAEWHDDTDCEDRPRSIPYEYEARLILTAARSIDPLVAEVVRLREEVKRLERDKAGAEAGLAMARSAITELQPNSPGVMQFQRTLDENKRLRTAIRTVLDDDETRTDGTGWGPDVTMIHVLQAALSDSHKGEGTKG